jgi:hypothetical protein
MKIADEIPFIPRLPHANGRGRNDPETPLGFGQLLTLEDGLEAVQAQNAAAIRPEIGSHAKSFSERPMVVRTAVDEAVRELPGGALSTADFLALGTSKPAADPARFLAALEEWADGHLPGAVPSSKEVGLSVPAEISGGYAIGPIRFWPITRPEHAELRATATEFRKPISWATETVIGIGQPRRVFGEAAASKGGLAKSASPNSPYATPQAGNLSPYSAVLVGSEAALRLIIRAPGLSPTDRAELELRISEVFSKRGMQVPQLQFRQPAAAHSTGTD